MPVPTPIGRYRGMAKAPKRRKNLRKLLHCVCVLCKPHSPLWVLYIALWPSYRNATVSSAPREGGGVKLTDVSMTPSIAMGDAGMLRCHGNFVSLQGDGVRPEALGIQKK